MPTPLKSLISTLNSAAAKNLSPDEIAAQLSNKGWIRLVEMTPQQAEFLDGQRCVVGADNGGESESFWIVSGEEPQSDWRFDARFWYPCEPCNSEFWFILYEEYENGSVPHQFAEQTRR